MEYYHANLVSGLKYHQSYNPSFQSYQSIEILPPLYYSKDKTHCKTLKSVFGFIVTSIQIFLLFLLFTRDALTREMEANCGLNTYKQINKSKHTLVLKIDDIKNKCFENKYSQPSFLLGLGGTDQEASNFNCNQG